MRQEARRPRRTTAAAREGPGRSRGGSSQKDWHHHGPEPWRHVGSEQAVPDLDLLGLVCGARRACSFWSTVTAADRRPASAFIASSSSSLRLLIRAIGGDPVERLPGDPLHHSRLHLVGVRRRNPNAGCAERADVRQESGARGRRQCGSASDETPSAIARLSAPAEERWSLTKPTALVVFSLDAAQRRRIQMEGWMAGLPAVPSPLRS